MITNNVSNNKYKYILIIKMDYKKHILMKFNYIKHIDNLEKEILTLHNNYSILANENIKLKKNITKYKLEKEELEDDIIQLQCNQSSLQTKQVLEYPESKYSAKKTIKSKKIISNDKKIKKTSNVSKVSISLQNLIKAREVKAQKDMLKKKRIELESHNITNIEQEPIPISIHIQKKIKLDIINDDEHDKSDNDNDNDSKNSDNIIFINTDSDSDDDVIHVNNDSDYDLVNDISFTSSFTKI